MLQSGEFDSRGQEVLLTLAHDANETSQLVEDLRDILHNPDYEQAVHDAVVAAGVPQRLSPSKSSAARAQLPSTQHLARAAAGTQSSAQSTITFHTAISGQLHNVSAAGTPAKDELAAHCGNSQQTHMGDELRQEVEHLLQRTDSILSRSSGHSTLHGASASHLPGLSLHTSNSSPHGATPLQQDLGGFDFETGSMGLETPTFSRAGARDAAAGGGTLSRRLTGEGGLSGRRRTTRTPGGVDSTTGARLSASSITPPIGTSSNGWGVPGPDYQQDQLQFVAEEGAAGGAGGINTQHSSSSRSPISLANRLSQQALTEIKDRLDGPDALSRYSSGLSAADHTTVVLDKSASWRQQAASNARSKGSRAAGDGSGAAGVPIYANFAPLEQLVDAALTDSVAGAAAGTGLGSSINLRGGQVGPGGPAGAAVGLRGGGGGGLAGAVVSLSRAGPSHTSHKLALGYMFQPEYIHSAAMARLKSELQSLSKPPSIVPGGSSFDVKLLALTARLSQWAQQERGAAETFQQLLDSILDSVFARLSPSRGRVAPPQATTTAAASAAAPAAGAAAPAPAPLSGSSTCKQQQLSGPAPTAAAAAAAPHVDQAHSGSAHKAGTPAAGAAPAVGGSASSTASCSKGVNGSSMAAAAADGARRMSQASTRRTSIVDHSPIPPPAEAAAATTDAPKPTESMLRAAFAKLALGQARLRGAITGVGAPGSPGRTATPPAAAAPAGVERGQHSIPPAPPDIGVAQRFSCCSISSSSSSSRQHSQAVEQPDAATLQQIQAAMRAAADASSNVVVAQQAAAAAAPAAAAYSASPWQSPALPSSLGTVHSSTKATVATAANPAATAAAVTPALNTGCRGCSSTQQQQPVACSCCCNSPQQCSQPVTPCQQSWHTESAHMHKLQQQQQQQQRSSPAAAPPLLQQQSHSMPQWQQKLPDQQQLPQPWLPQPWQQPQPHEHLQQQQQQQQQWMAAPAQDAWRRTQPSKLSPGRDTLTLARQAHKLRMAALPQGSNLWGQQLLQGPQQQPTVGGDVCGYASMSQQLDDATQAGDSGVDGSSTPRRCLFSSTQQPSKQQQQQQQQQQNLRESWLLPGSPGSLHWAAATSPPQAMAGTASWPAGGLTRQTRPLTQIHCGQPQHQLLGVERHGGNSSSPLHPAQAHSVRVTTAAGAPAAAAAAAAAAHSGLLGCGSSGSGSPPRFRLPLAGGCCDVYPDAVEVHSQHGSPIMIDVLPCQGPVSG